MLEERDIAIYLLAYLTSEAKLLKEYLLILLCIRKLLRRTLSFVRF